MRSCGGLWEKFRPVDLTVPVEFCGGRSRARRARSLSASAPSPRQKRGAPWPSAEAKPPPNSPGPVGCKRTKPALVHAMILS